MYRYMSAVALAVGVSLIAPDAVGAAEVKTGAADHITARVNQERSAHGLAPLAVRSDITEIALEHSRAMANGASIWHNDAYFTAATRERLNAQGLGENVALNGDIEDAHQRLMASPGHRANILNGRFDAVGIAVVQEGGALYITQNFVDSASTASASASAPEEAKAGKATKKGKSKRKFFKARSARAKRR